MPVLKTQTPDRILVALVFRSLKLRDKSQIFTEKNKAYCQFIWTVRQTFKCLISNSYDTSYQIFLHSFTPVFEQETGKK